MTVMLLQRFSSPQTNQSPKAIINDGLAITSVISSAVGTTGTGSASPSVTSLSTPSPTPLPFLFLLESQESWEEEEEEEEEEDRDVPSINSEECDPRRDDSSRGESLEGPTTRVYARFNVTPVESLLIEESGGPRRESPENENDDFSLNNNNNNNNINNKNDYHNRRNRNGPYRPSVIIPSEYENNRGKTSLEFAREKREFEGWTAGGEAPNASGARNLGGVRDCGVAAAAAAAGSGSVTGGAASGHGGVAGYGGASRLGGHSFSCQQPSDNSGAFPADSRIGGTGGAGAACGPATTANDPSTCGPGGGPRFESQGVAMRYYRLWIYACNIVLLGSALGFATAVSRYLVFTADPRRYLVPGVPQALDPTALYAYLALAAQLGLVQLLGCIAARRLSAKLLNAYWMILLALLFGDVVIGVAWVFRFGRMKAELRPTLRLRLQIDYGKDNRFSEHWDRLQRDFSCCGIAGHEDFEGTGLDNLPPSCCPTPSSLVENDVTVGNDTNDVDYQTPTICQQPFSRGCEATLGDWLRETAHLLFVLSICVIAFAKLCFLGILRYEIREMIQKIRLLREPPLPPPSAITGGSSSILCTSPPFVQSSSQLGASPVVDSILTTTTNTHINNNNNNTSSNNNNAGAGPRRTTLPMAALPSGNSSIIQQSEDYSGVRHPLLSSNLQDGGADSDTNSHCALILEETTPPSISTHSGCTASTRPDKSNGNNNYEMREFNRRLLISNGAAGATGNLNAPVTNRNRRT